MNSIFIGLAAIVSFVGIITGIVGVLIAMYSDLILGECSKKELIASIFSFLFGISLITYISIKYPQPTFREVCEANNGTYIDNNGRAGDSCIYNKRGKE